LWNPRLTSVVGQAGIPQFTKKYANPSFLLISKYYPQLELCIKIESRTANLGKVWGKERFLCLFFAFKLNKRGVGIITYWNCVHFLLNKLKRKF
jgi:hypothetical protein